MDLNDRLRDSFTLYIKVKFIPQRKQTYGFPRAVAGIEFPFYLSDYMKKS
jgi:hypothetical protein